MVLRIRRRRPLPDRRHLLADGDGRDPDLAVTRRNSHQAGLGDAAASGIDPLLVDAEGKEFRGATSGNLCLAWSWPGQMRTVWCDHRRFFETYFTTYPGRYFTGDGCRRDEDGYYWITGRVDDVINVSGHRIGTAEVESALVAHGLVAEAAVVAFPHDIKGQAIHAYVTLNAGEEGGEDLRKELNQEVRRRDRSDRRSRRKIQFAPSLPKTRSGKIMRRVLRKIAKERRPASATFRPWPTPPSTSSQASSPERASSRRRPPKRLRRRGQPLTLQS